MRLRLSQFRCYEALSLTLSGRPVVLTGANGSGKTNVLEALSYLAPGRGLRRARLSEVARRQGDGRWAVAATLAQPSGTVRLGTGLDTAGEGEKRQVRIEGEPAPSTALSRLTGVHWVTPHMDRLFIEGPGGRRRFLDRLVFGFDPEHAARVNAYEKAVRQRLHLLRAGRGDAHWLAALESQMAAQGVAIAAARRDAVARLRRGLQQSTGPFPRAEVAVAGRLEGWLEASPAVEAEGRFAALLADNRGADRDSGSTLDGPHRSDLEVVYADKGEPAARCSTGEQKALLLAIVLANARLEAARRGAAPLLLLDEVAAHLDAGRRRALFQEVLGLGGQAWLTGTDRALFAPLDGAAEFLTVRDARIAVEE